MYTPMTDALFMCVITMEKTRAVLHVQMLQEQTHAGINQAEK